MNQNVRNPITILLVDDDQFVHEMVGSLIDDAEYSLISATSAGDALKVMMDQIPDIIITDALMPGDSGFSLINTVKSDPRTRNIPIILLTILQEPNGAVMDASGQADFRVSKPLYLSDFTATLEQARQLVNARSEISDVRKAAEVEILLPEAEDTVTIVF